MLYELWLHSAYSGSLQWLFGWWGRNCYSECWSATLLFIEYNWYSMSCGYLRVAQVPGSGLVEPELVLAYFASEFL